MAILCIGDSLTYGKVGYSYIDRLKTDQPVINAGKNGDTLHRMTQRLRRILDGCAAETIDTCVVGIGTNDLLLPYLCTLSPLWAMQFAPRCRRMQCITDDKEFAFAYEQMLEYLKRRQLHVILIGIPYLQLEHFPHDKICRYNQIIRSLAHRYGCGFVDLYGMQLHLAPSPCSFSWQHRNLPRMLDSAGMTLFPPIKAHLERTRRLELSVDGVHYNRRSAAALAAAVDLLLDKSSCFGSSCGYGFRT